MSVEERFWSRVTKSPSGCWLWTGSSNNSGYGSIGISAGKVQLVHRFSYELHNSPIPKGMVVLHSCDVRLCVNPNHLSVGTQQDNVKDAFSKGRGFRGGCKRPQNGERNHGSKFSNQDVKEMKRLYHSGEWSQRQLAYMFGMSHSNANLILTGKSRTND